MPIHKIILLGLVLGGANLQAANSRALSAVGVFEEIMNAIHGEVTDLIAPDDYRAFAGLRQIDSAMHLNNDLDRANRGYQAVYDSRSAFTFQQIITDQRIVELTQTTEIAVFDSSLTSFVSNLNPAAPSFLARIVYNLSVTFRCLNPTTLNLNDLSIDMNVAELTANSCRLVGVTGVNARTAKKIFSVELSHAAPAGETGR